ncbi:MAG: hypothetical protein U0324_44005 [Polyangiales bacterium]
MGAPVRRLPVLGLAANDGARVLPNERVTRRELAELRAADPPGDERFVMRPVTREECREGGINGERPCPWVSCKHHLYLDVNERTGAVTLNRPGVEVWDLEETCALDVAERGEATHDEIASLLGITRGGAWMLERTALRKLDRPSVARLLDVDRAPALAPPARCVPAPEAPPAPRPRLATLPPPAFVAPRPRLASLPPPAWEAPLAPVVEEPAAPVADAPKPRARKAPRRRPAVAADVEARVRGLLGDLARELLGVLGRDVVAGVRKGGRRD